MLPSPSSSALPSPPPSPLPALLGEFRGVLSDLVGLPVLEGGQRINGALLSLGAEHLSVLSASSAVKVSAALAELGISPVEEGELSLEGDLCLYTEDGLWALSGPGGTVTGYEYTLTGEGEDPAVVEAVEAAFASLVGEVVLGVSLEVDGSLVFSFASHTFRVWPPPVPEVPPEFPLRSWALLAEESCWFHGEGLLGCAPVDAVWGSCDRSTPIVAGLSLGSPPSV